MPKNFTDQEVIDGLLKKEVNLTNQIVAHLYNSNQASITKMVIANNGRLEDAEDIFQEVILVFLKQVQNREFTLIEVSSSNTFEKKYVRISTYLYKLAHLIWLKKLTRDNKQKHWEAKFVEAQNIDDEYTPFIQLVLEEETSRYQQVYNQLKEECKKILYGYYVLDQSLKEIAQELNITEGSVRVKKYRCIEDLKKLFRK